LSRRFWAYRTDSDSAINMLAITVGVADHCLASSILACDS
jgi:hypothetical protein